MFNPYVEEPFKVVVFDPRANGIKPSTHIFLTNVPRTIVNQCKRAGKNAMKIPAVASFFKNSNRTIFREEPVPNKSSILGGFDLPGASETAETGETIETDLFEDFDKPGELVVKNAVESIAIDQKETVTDTSQRNPGVIFHGMDVFPDDNINELRNKIFVTTRIEPYRQHLFCVKYDGTEKQFYEIFFNNTPVNVSILDEKGETFDKDQIIEKNRDLIRVEPREEFSTLGNESMKVVYVVDLLEIFPPRKFSTELSNNPYLLDRVYFGTVVKYWPQTSHEMFKLAMIDPGKLYEIFPLLSPSVENSREVIDTVNKLSTFVYKHSKPIKGGYSITRATIVVPTRVLTKVDIRNAFDWIPSTCSYPIMTLNFKPDYIKTRDQITIVKQNVTICSINAQEIVKRVPKEFSATFMLPKTVASYAEIEPGLVRTERVKHNLGNYTALSIFQNGKYVIRSNWDRDMDFERVNKELADFAGLIIPEVNKMGTAAIVMGEALKVPTGKPSPVVANMIPDAYYGSLDLYVIWKKSVTIKGFNMIRNELLKYEKYGLVDIKTAETTQNIVGFYFKKGDVYQKSCLDRIIAISSAQQGIVNLYDHMSDPTAMARWNSVFRGRMVTLTHRTTDVRIDYSCVTYDELIHIHSYVIGLLLDVSSREEFEVETSDVRNRLRALQEADPELFDMRRHDPESKLYSVLCQSERQPVTTSDRARATKMKRAVEFWNFTEKKPQWYSCPSSDYPFLTFRVGEHPLGYCLPCCKKDPPMEQTRGNFIQNKCLAKYVWKEENEDELREDLGAAFSQQKRHILGYGKMVTPGRISAVPQILEQGLFYGEIDPDYTFRLVGVEQTLPSIPDAGFAFALAKCLNLTLEEMIMEFVATIKEMGALYTSVGFGSGKSFATNEELVGALMAGFVERSRGFSPFGPGGKSSDDWQEMFESLIYFSKRVVVLVVEDETGNETLNLRVLSSRFETLSYAKVKLVILLRHPSGIYPMALVNQNSYVRLAKSAKFVFDTSDGFVKIIIDMVGRTIETRRDKPIDYTLVKDFCKAGKYWIAKKYVNNRNICYALSLAKNPKSTSSNPSADSGESAQIYLPISYEIVRIDGIQIEYGFPSENELSEKKDSVKLIRHLAEFVANRRKYKEITIGEQIVAKNEAIGFRVQKLNMFHKPSPPTKDPTILFNFNVFDVNEKLYLVDTEPRLPEKKEALADKASYVNNLYDFLVGEFVARLRQDKNEEVRGKILAEFKKSPSSARGLMTFKKAVEGLGGETESPQEDRPIPQQDVKILWNLLDSSYTLDNKNWKSIFADKFRSTNFAFDMLTLENMRKEDPRKLGKKIQDYMKSSVLLKKMRNDGDFPSIGNILTQCSNTDMQQAQCESGKLIVSEDLYADFVDILASDIKNPYIDILIQEGQNVDEMEFIERPEEQLLFV